MLTEFHKAALTFMLDHPEDLHLTEQIEYLSIIDVEHTGYGCIYTYELSRDAPINVDQNLQLLINLGKTMYSKEIIDGAAMILNVREGKIDALEIDTHDAEYPQSEPTRYRFENTPYNLIDQRDIQG